MGSSASIPAETRVVIVGGGYAGTTLAISLLKQGSDFTLVTPGDSFHHNLGAVRATCVPGFAQKTLIPLETTFGAHFKKATVIEIKPEVNQVVLSTSESLTYDILVIATGTVHKWPIKLVGPERDESLKQYASLVEKVQAANKVVVIGGGPTGTELAAEVASAYPEKEVTLIHGSEHLLTSKLQEKSQQKLQEVLTKDLNIKLVLGQRVENLEELPDEGPATIKTDKGSEIEADIVLRCTGLTLKTDAFENGLSECMDEKTKALKVNEFLQVEGHEKIFALGDCNNVPETKLAYHAIEQAKVLIKTLNAITTGGKPVPYRPERSPMTAVISLGPNKGFGEKKGGMLIPSFILASFKSKDLMSGDTWKEFRQTMPK